MEGKDPRHDVAQTGIRKKLNGNASSKDGSRRPLLLLVREAAITREPWLFSDRLRTVFDRKAARERDAGQTAA